MQATILSTQNSIYSYPIIYLHYISVFVQNY